DCRAPNDGEINDPVTHGWLLLCGRTRSSPATAQRAETLQLPDVAVVRLYVQSTPVEVIGVSSKRGVAGRPFGQVRYDLLLQIGPSVSDRRAGYVLRL